jgi:hypothetical protein
MSDQINIAVQTRADTSGFTAAEQAAQRSAATFAGLTAQEQKAAASALQLSTAAQRLATEEQRTAQTANQAAVAAQRLATEEQRTAAAVSAAAAAQTRAEASAFRLAQAQDKAATAAQRGATYAAQMGQAFTSSLMGIIGPAAAAGVALQALSQTGALIQLGAQAQQTQLRFEGLATAAGTTGEALLGAMRSASAGTISDLNLELAANRANLLGVADSAKEFSVLMEIARSRAQDMGISTTQAFNDLITGLGRGSALILDNLGITVSVTEANKAYAAQLGKNASALSEAEQKQALINAVLDQGKASLEAAGGAAETNAAKLERLGAAWENTKAAVGGGIADAVLPTSDAIVALGQATDGSRESLLRYVDAASAYNGANEGVAAVNRDAAAAILDFLGVQDASAIATERSAAAQSAAAMASSLAASMQAELASNATTLGGALDVASSAANNVQIAHQEAAAAAMAQTAALLDTRQESIAASAEAVILAQSTRDAGFASMEDAAAKTEQAAKTELASAMALAAADAFMMLHPNISASGVASLVTAGQIDPLLAQLVMARIRASEASAELARFRALSGVKALRAPGSNSVDRTDADEIRAGKREQAIQLRNARVQGAQEAAAAEARYQQALGNYAPALDRANADLAQIGKTRGTDSAEYINQLTKITQLEGQAASAAKKGGGGGGGRAAGGADKAAKAAEATGTRLGDIARQGGNKLADIEEATQNKLAAIDAKYAEQRAESQRALFDEIARMSSGAAFDQQLNDFEQFGKDISDEQKALFAAREAAEIRYNERIRQAQEEAKAEAVNDDADLASEKLKIREAEAKRQMEIENRAAQASIDSEGKNVAAIAQTAQEASAASKAQADTDIAIAEAKAAEKAGAMQAEKDAVIAAANEQAQKVISAAEEQATKVKGASDSQKSTVIDNLRAQADAAAAWAAALVEASRTGQRAMGSVTGPPAPATPEGGEGIGAPAAEGSEPGGQGIAGGQGIGRSASGGGGSMTDAIQTLNDAATIITMLKPFVASNKGAVKLLNEYKLVVQSAVGSLLAIQDLRERLVQPQPVLDLAVVARLKQDVEAVVAMMFNIDASMTSKVRVLTKYLELETASIDILNGVIDLRGKLSQPTPPIDLAYVAQLHAESQAVVQTLLSQMMPVNQQQLTLLQRYATAQGQSVQILTDVADLRERLSGDIGGPFDMAQITQFAKRAAEFVRLIDQQIVPLTEEQAAGFSHYADAAGAAVQILIDVADLRERLSGDIGSPFDMAQIQKFAERAAEFTRLIQSQLVPMSEEASDSLSRYADSAGAAIQILVDVADLRQRMSEDIGGPFDMNLIQRLATEAHKITQLVQSVLIPTTEEQTDSMGRWADTVGGAVAIVSDVAGLRKDVTDLAGPIPIAAIAALAAEAKRITAIVQSQLIPTTEETATGFSAYGEVVNSAVGIISDVAGLRKDVLDLAPPISDVQIRRLAADAKRITAIVLSQMIPASEEQAEAAKRYADTTGSAVKALSDTLGLPAKMFTDYVSPSDAQINRVVADANRIVKGVDRAAKTYSTDGLAAAQAFGDATGSILSSFKEQLLFAQAIGSGDFAIDAQKLSIFEKGMAQTLAVASRLGAQAALIPPGNIVALQNTTAALTAAYESMIRLSAVPFGNIPQMTGALGSAGGGGSVVNNVTINTLPGQSNQQIADMVMQRLGQRIGSRH